MPVTKVDNVITVSRTIDNVISVNRTMDDVISVNEYSGRYN